MALIQATTAIITRTKDRNLLVPRAVESVLEQTCDDWVHVIVNDGGDRDALEAVLAPYHGRYRGRLVVVHHPVSVGMEAASNAGIAAADSRFVLIHDDDDTLHPAFLARCAPLLAVPPLPSVRAVASLVRVVEESIDGNRVTEQASRRFRELGPMLSLGEVANCNPCPPISFLFRRDAWAEAGRFDETLPVLGDWDFLLRLVERHDVCVLQEELANYHIRPALAGGVYSNTVTAGLDRHRLYDAWLRNRYARTGSNPTLALLVQAYGDPNAAGSPLRALARVEARVDLLGSQVEFIRQRMPISILRRLYRVLTGRAGGT